MKPAVKKTTEEHHRMYVVCAGSATEARTWAREHGIPRRHVVYGCHPGNVAGIRNFTTVILPSSFGHRDWRKVQAVLRWKQMKMAANSS